MKNIIPTINIASILKEDFYSIKSIRTINKIKKACINIGFFQITGHGILIIVSSGIYIFLREKAQDQSIVTDKPLR
jgi:isopenicillin N synthase-like dioxygenase